MNISANKPKEHTTTYKEILERVHNDENVLLSIYLEVVKIPCLINSPLRDDKKPSFRFLKDRYGNIHWIDFTTGESGNLIDFLMAYLKLNYEALIDRLDTDTGGPSLPRGTKARAERLAKNSKKLNRWTLAATHREWQQYDVEYWASYGITLEWLKKANVFPVQFIWYIGEDGDKFYFPAEKYAYVYYEMKDGITRCKVYQPYSTKRKWQSNLTEDIWSLWTLLPKTGDNVFITSSLKDGLNLYINTGIPSVSMQGEGYEPKPQIIEELKRRFTNVWIFFDNDYKNPNNPGRTDAKKLCKKYGLFYVEIPARYEAKDPSDLYKKYGHQMYMGAIKEAVKTAQYAKFINE